MKQSINYCMLYLIASIILFSLSSSLLAQQESNYWLNVNKNSSIQFPSKKVNATDVILETSEAQTMLMVGTPEGAFIHFGAFSRKLPELANKNILNVKVDPAKGGIWFCTEQDGLIYFVPDKNKSQVLNFTKKENELVSMTVRDIIPDVDGGYYVANGNAISKIDPQIKFTTINLTSDPSLSVNTLAYDKGTKKLYAGCSKGIYLIEEDQAKLLDGSEQYGSIQKLIFEKGKLWIAAEKGLLYYAGEEWKVIAPNTFIASIAVSSFDGLFAITPKGELTLYSLKEGKEIQKFKQEEGAIITPVCAMTAAPSGNLYIGTQESGLIQKIRDNWYQTSHIGLLTDNIWSTISFSPDKYSNEMWLGTDKGLSAFVVVEQKKGRQFRQLIWEDYTPQNSPIPDKKAIDMLHDKNNLLWIAFAEGGVASFNRAKRAWNIYTKETNTFPSTQATDLFLSSEGVLMATTADAGYAIFENGKWKSFGKKEGLPTEQINKMAEGRDKSLWFVSPMGLFSLKEKRYSSFDKELGAFSIKNIYSIALSQKDGNIFLGTDKGLLLAKGGDMAKLEKVAPELQDKVIRQIVLDKEGNALLACLENGLYAYTTKGKVAKLSGIAGLRANEARYMAFDESELFLSTEKGLFIGAELGRLLREMSISPIEVNKKTIYPNPANEKVCFGKLVKMARLYTLSGELVASCKDKEEMNISHLTEGTYLLTLDGVNHTLFIKR